MKKILLFILISLCFLYASLNQPEANKLGPNLQTAISLPEEYHPTYAPVVTIKDGNETSYANYFLQLLAGSLIYLAGPTAVLVIAIGGLRYVTSHGDQTQMDGAKNTLKWGIVGLVVIILSFAIVRAVISVMLGIN